MNFPFNTFHIPISFEDPDAKYSPSDEKTTLQTSEEWHIKVLIRFPLLHTPIVLSDDPDAKYSPFGEKTTLLTYFLWPVRVWMRSPLYTSHIPISFKDPDAK